MNKKAGTFGFWIEVMIFLVLFIVIIGFIGGEFNQKYGTTNDLTLGIDVANITSDLTTYSNTIQNDTGGGQASSTDFGVIKLTTLPSILLGVTNLVWSFVSGEFISKIIMAMNLGVYSSSIAFFFRILYVVAIAFIFLKIITRAPV